MSLILNNYQPISTNELQIYEKLWIASSPKNGEISGLEAVKFLQNSDVQIQILKQIWSLSTPALTMNKAQFFTALRYIAMAQKGETNLSYDRLVSTIHVDFGPPYFKSLDIDVKAAIIPSVSSISPIASINSDSYVITTDDHLKYYQLFLQYDADGDGFMTGQESLGLFNKSGLDKKILRDIWLMSDVDEDNRLTSKEFCVAFHLILAVSKKNLPLPVQLPPSLKSFLDKAPSNPITPSSASIVETVKLVDKVKLSPYLRPLENTTIPPSQSAWPIAPAPAPAPAPVASRPNLVVTSINQIQPIALPGPVVNVVNEEEANQAVNSLKSQINEAIKLATSNAESANSTSSVLRGVLKRLLDDKQALAASLKTAKGLNDEAGGKLDLLVKEIAAATNEISDLKDALIKAHNKGTKVQAEIGMKSIEKRELIQQIADMRKEISEVTSQSVVAADQLLQIQSDKSKTQQISEQLVNQRHELNSSIAVMNEDLSTLQHILSALSSDRKQRQMELNKYTYEIAETKLALIKAKKRNSGLESEVSDLSETRDDLRKQIDRLLVQINEMYTVDAAISTSPKSNQFIRSNSNESLIVNTSVSSAVTISSSVSNASIDNIIDEPVSYETFNDSASDVKIDTFNESTRDITADHFDTVKQISSKIDDPFASTNSLPTDTSDPFTSQKDKSDTFVPDKSNLFESQPADKTDTFISQDRPDLFISQFNKSDSLISDKSDGFTTQTADKSDPFIAQDKSDPFNTQDNSDPFITQDNSDPFNTHDKSDPFITQDNSDPFESHTTDKSDPFASTVTADSLESADPFTTKTTDNDIQSTDLFASANVTFDAFNVPAQVDSSNIEDPFVNETSKTIASPVNTDPFKSNDLSTDFNAFGNDSKASLDESFKPVDDTLFASFVPSVDSSQPITSEFDFSNASNQLSGFDAFSSPTSAKKSTPFDDPFASDAPIDNNNNPFEPW
eukprot:gene19331-25195_t